MIKLSSYPSEASGRNNCRCGVSHVTNYLVCYMTGDF